MNFSNALPLALGLLLFSFLLNSLLTVPFIDFLYKLKLTRKKEANKKEKVNLFDKLHDIKAGTPVGGGVLIVLSVVVLFSVLLPLSNKMGLDIQTGYTIKYEIITILFTFVSFGILGLVDDLVKIFGKPTKGKLGMIVGLKRKEKFFLQWLLALIIGYLLYAKLGITHIYIPIFDYVLNLGWLYIPLSALVIVSFTNAFNITDGLDGLASGLLLICLFAFWIIAAANLDTPLTIFIAVWIGALIAFLYFNVYPARVFLGDTGALSFGATLAVIGLMSGSIFALIIIGGLFVVELLSSFIQIIGWKYLNKPILPLAPLHNTFLTTGWQEPKIVMRAWLTGIMLAIFGLWLATI